MRVLFASAAWGLGHATRDLVLVKALLAEGHSVVVLSTGRALQLLRGELGSSCRYIDLPDIPVPISRRAFWFYVRMSLAMPLVLLTFRREHRFVEALCKRERFDRIVSDTRYGVFSARVPSYYIVHSLRQVIPGRPRLLEAGVERAQKGLLWGGHKILVPDVEGSGLAGDLCHRLACSWQPKVEYIGILSSVRRQAREPDVDYFVSVSGAEPQRTIFEETVLRQCRSLPGRVVVALGKPDAPQATTALDGGRITVHTYLNRARQEEMLNRARLVVSRSGYTTLMELAELGKRALLVPTVGQSEQEYLGAYHERLGTFHCVTQRRLDLGCDALEAEAYSGLAAREPTACTVKRFLAALAC
jgi:UDP:flavonoid glycosyltransferase YjiC (YdhE family)